LTGCPGWLGIPVEAAAAAESDGLLEFGARVTFRHPLVRSAVYRAAPPAEKQAVQRALAQATDPELDPDRRAWHRARATPAPDEDVAEELERGVGGRSCSPAAAPDWDAAASL
jgi:hypothetical protein